MLGQSALHLRCRNTQERHVFSEMLVARRVLVRIEQVVHLPELLVRARCLRNLGLFALQFFTKRLDLGERVLQMQLDRCN